MLKGKLTLIATVFAVSSPLVHAASNDIGSKSGWFVGAEYNKNRIQYTTIETTYGGVENDNISPKKVTNELDGFKLNFGKRYALNSSNSLLKRLGFALKGWAGQDSYKITNKVNHTINSVAGGEVSNAQSNTPFTIQANALVVGAEMQMYYDLISFKTKSISHTMGLTFGVGYELSQFSNVNFKSMTKAGTEFIWSTSDFYDSGFVYDVAFHYVIAKRNRIELGYRMNNYTKLITAPSPDRNKWNTNTITYKQGFNNLSTIYAAYTFTF